MPQAAWSGLIEDAAALAAAEGDPGDPSTPYVERRRAWYADLVGPLVVRDTELAVVPAEVPVVAVLSSGAGVVAGVASMAARRGLRLMGLVAAVRDLDDPSGNVRRLHAAVEAARGDGALAETEVYVELPATPVTPAWLSAADAVAEAEAHFSFRLAGAWGDIPSSTAVAGWIDAALDRESSYRCADGVDHAVRHRDHGSGSETHGFLNLLLATRRAFDGGTVAEVADLLDDAYPNDLVALARTSDLAGVRRWLTSFGSNDVAGSVEELVELGLVEPPGEPTPVG